MKNKKSQQATSSAPTADKQIERLTRDADKISGDLLAWFAQHGRHTLPWQHPRSPYYVWLSEIMLQQTQVATVIPYFEKFVSHYPDIQALAAAEQDDVLSHWSGLGYYARARNLHKTARQIVAEYGAQFPNQYEQLIELSGIGRSTANAILAQAFAIPAPILDGNVRRILARLTCLEQPPQDAVDQLWSYAEIITPDHSAADFTQAIMDLGALVCSRSKPKCDNCPLQKHCDASAQDKTADYPRKKAGKKKPTKQQDFYLYLSGEGESTELLLQKRPSTGIWGGLWCLPTNNEVYLDQRGNAQELAMIEHTFTHYHLQLQPILCRVRAEDISASQQHAKTAVQESGSADGETKQWFAIADALKKGLPAPIRVLLENLQAEQS